MKPLSQSITDKANLIIKQTKDVNTAIFICELFLREYEMLTNGLIYSDDPSTFDQHDYWKLVLKSIRDIQSDLITKDWLLKFGFDKGNNIDVPIYVFKKKFKLDGINSTLSYNFKENYLHINQRNNSVYVGIFKYIHQLQNLYFTLTGEELTLSVT